MVQPYFRNIRASQHKDTITSSECNFTNKAVVNGMTFTANSWLPDFTDKDNPILYEVGNIVLMDRTDIRSIYLICKVYQNILYDEHFVAYSVDLGQKIKLINLILHYEYQKTFVVFSI